MTQTYELKTIQQAVELATTLTRSWFRGHTKVFDELTPGIFRNRYTNPPKPKIEFNMIETFKREAPGIVTTVPAYDDHVSWLFLMQHHGTPTRLLDWARNALIALYFSVYKHPKKDGELWAMYPTELNNLSRINPNPTPKNEIMRYLAAEPNYINPADLIRDLNIQTPHINMTAPPEYPISVLPPMNFPRMFAQQSTFTIHPKPKNGNTIPELLTDEKYLVRYIIPANNKDKLLSDLVALGITHRTLFPDLDALSKSIINEHNIIAYNPPKPPQWP